MTEADWLAANIEKLLAHLRKAEPSLARNRRLLRFACHCARRAEAHLYPRSLESLVVFERAVDEPVSRRDLDRARRVAQEEARISAEAGITRWVDLQAAETVVAAGQPDAWRAAWDASYHLGRALPSSFSWQADVIREVFGNPIQAVVLPKGWRVWSNRLLVRLARQAYQQRDFTGLPVLADALEDAGCTDAALLEHCRSGGAHLTGCWALELLRDEE